MERHGSVVLESAKLLPVIGEGWSAPPNADSESYNGVELLLFQRLSARNAPGLYAFSRPGLASLLGVAFPFAWGLAGGVDEGNSDHRKTVGN